MAGMSKKDVRRLLKALEHQGLVIEELKVGARVRLPNNEVLVVHWTTSDTKSLDAMRAVVKRGGYLWPFDDSRAIRDVRKQRRKES